MYFIRSLELSQIKNEDWKAWSTYLGSTHQTMSHNSLQSACRTYYSTHMAPLKAFQPQEYAYATFTSPSTQHPNTSSTTGIPSSQTPPSGRGRGRGNDRGNTNRGGRGGGFRGGRGNGGGDTQNTRRNLPRDPKAWCTYCERPGHAATYCFSKFKDSGSSLSLTDCCASQSATQPPKYSLSQSPTSALTPSAPPSNRAPGPQQPAKDHGHGYTVRSCRCLTSSMKDSWIYDTACTEHMTDQSTFFSTYDAFETPVDVHGINGLLQALGQGDVIVTDPHGNTHTLLDVWYVPGLNDSIISKNWTKHSGLHTTMDENENFQLRSTTSRFHITSTNIGKISIIKNLKVVEYTPSNPATVRVTITTPDPAAQLIRPLMTNASAQLMHQRLCHPSVQRMRLVGIKYNPEKCHFCIMGKQTRKPFPTNPNPRATRKLFRVYSDICPVSPETFGHGLYFITFVDEATRYVWVYIIPNKTSSTVLQILKSWLPLVQNQAGTTLINFRTDEGGEYLGETLKTVSTFLEEHGITHEQTSPYSSSSNGIAERINRTLMDMVRTMMITSKLPAPFWGEAVHTAAKVRNRLPTSSLGGNISPHEAWFGKAPSLEHLRVFGCLAFYSIKHPKTKVQSRGRRCCFLGYEGTTQFRVYDPATNKVVSHVRTIDFFEDEFLEANEFAHVPYADRPLLVPEPRNYTEEDEEINDEDLDPFSEDPDPEIPELVDDIDIPMPAYRPVRQAPVHAPRPRPRWPIPPPPRPSADSSDSDSDSMPSLASVPASEVGSRPGSQHSSQVPSQPVTPERPPEASRPPTPEGEAIRRSGRPPKPSEKKLEGEAQARKRPAQANKTLVAHTGPSLHSTSPHYVASYAPPNEPRTLEEAMASPYASQLTAAILHEMALSIDT